MGTIEIKLLKYTFLFKSLTWREEFGITYDQKRDRIRQYLAHALVEVSGLKINTVLDAWKVISPIPDPVLRRVHTIYKGSLPSPKLFTTLGLYKAPEPSRFHRTMEKVEKAREQVMDKVEREMEEKFGRKELEDAKRTEREMARNSKMRGATPATEEKNGH